MQKVVPTLTSVDPLPYDGVQPEAQRPPKVQGKAFVGGNLTATPGTWDKRGVKFTYQWLRDGEPVADATRKKLAADARRLGHRMSVRVTASRPGAFPGEAVSAKTAKVQARRSATEACPTLVELAQTW